MQNTDQTGQTLKPLQQLNRILLRFPLDQSTEVLKIFKDLKRKQGVVIEKYVLEYGKKDTPIVLGYDSKGLEYRVPIYERSRIMEPD